MQGVGVKRVVDEEGDGGRKVLCMCVCVCVMTWLPFTFCLSVWCCCECWRRTCEEPDSGQQNGTPAWVFTIPPPLLSLSLCLPGLQLKTHIFSGVCVWGGGVSRSEGNQTHQKPKDGECSCIWPGRSALSDPTRLPYFAQSSHFRRMRAFMPHFACHT